MVYSPAVLSPSLGINKENEWRLLKIFWVTSLLLADVNYLQPVVVLSVGLATA